MNIRSVLIVVASLVVVDAVWSHHPHDIVSAVAVSPDFARDHTVLCTTPGTMRLLLLSQDGGFTWTSKLDGLRGTAFTDVEFAPDWSTSRTIFVSTEDGGLQVSRNAGTFWDRQPWGMNGPMYEIAASPLRQDNSYVLFAAGFGGIFRSTNAGRGFEMVVTLPVGVHVHALEVSPTFATDGTVIASTSDQKLLISRSEGTRSSWSEISTPVLIEDVALSPTFAVDSLAWVATWGQGVQFLTLPPNGSATFMQSTGPVDAFVNDVEVIPAITPGATPNVVFASTKDDGAFASVDYGITWFQLPLQAKETHQTDNHYRTILVSPNWLTDGIVYCGTYEGLYVAMSWGLEWTEVEIDPVRCGRHISTSPTFELDDTVFAIGYGGSVMRSRDRGGSWTDCGVGFKAGSVYDLELSPEFANDRTVIAGVWHGVRVSHDGGDTWTRVDLPENPGVPNVDISPSWTIRDIEFSPEFSTDRTVFAIGMQGTVYESTDGGDSWHWAYSQLLDNNIVSLQISPDFQQDRTIFVGAGSGIFVSHDAGRSFQQTTTTGVASHGMTLPSDYGATGEFYAANAYRGFLVFSNEGRSQQLYNSGFDGFTPTKIVLSPRFVSDSTIFATTEGNGIYVSTDRGRTWAMQGTAGNRPGTFTMALSPAFASDRTMFIGNHSGHHRSTDSGASWHPITSWAPYDDFRDPWSFHGSWNRRDLAGTMLFASTDSTTAGDRAVLPFEGVGVRLYCAVGPDYGMATIEIDGHAVQTIDTYAPTASGYTEVAWISGMPHGLHVLEIVVSGSANPASRGTHVGIDQARVYYR